MFWFVLVSVRYASYFSSVRPIKPKFMAKYCFVAVRPYFTFTLIYRILAIVILFNRCCGMNNFLKSYIEHSIIFQGSFMPLHGVARTDKATWAKILWSYLAVEISARYVHFLNIISHYYTQPLYVLCVVISFSFSLNIRTILT